MFPLLFLHPCLIVPDLCKPKHERDGGGWTCPTR